MFAAPPVINSEVFARVPDRLRARENVRLQSGVPRDCFLEGLSFDRAGNLYVTNIPYGQIFRVSPQGEFTLVAEYDGEPNGLKIHRDGRIFIADHSRLGRPLAEIRSCAGIGTTNAAYGGPDGKTIYVTESETGTILSARLEAAGKQMYSHM